MSRLLFTAAGCARCRITKRFMEEHGIFYEEYDAVGDGKERFGEFYRANRGAISRGKDGIEFPVLAEAAVIRQGVAVVIAYLCAGVTLDGFIRRSDLGQGWVGGLNVSGGDPAAVDQLVAVLEFLKRSGLKLQLNTFGKNAEVLKILLEKEIGDRVVMELKGPQALYGALVGEELDVAEVTRTMAVTTKFPEFRFETVVAPVIRQPGRSDEVSYLTPGELEQAARWLKDSTGSHRQPYLLRFFEPTGDTDPRLKAVEKLSPTDLIRYRTAARKHQVLAEVEKPPG